MAQLFGEAIEIVHRRAAGVFVLVRRAVGGAGVKPASACAGPAFGPGLAMTARPDSVSGSFAKSGTSAYV